MFVAVSLATAAVIGAACFGDVLEHLASSPRGCMIREDCSTNSSAASLLLPRFPIYVLHAPWLVRRKAHMRRQLMQLGAADVTWLTCANRDDVSALDASMRACAYPCVQLNRYVDVNKTTFHANALSNGTVSLAIKHKMAAWDIVRRRLSAALVLEDDAVLPPDLWQRMVNLHPPPSCQLFWMGSYSKRTNVGTLSQHTRVGDNVYKRNASMFPVILGAVAYVLYHDGAALVASEPVTTPADIAISLFPRAGVTHTVVSADAKVRLPLAGGGGAAGGGHHHGHESHGRAPRTFADGTCEDDLGNRFEQRTPPEQYAPREWIIWPVPREEQELRFGDHGGTHQHGRRVETVEEGEEDEEAEGELAALTTVRA